MVTVDDKKLHWSSTKGSRGWCLISYSSDYIEGYSGNDDDDTIFWYVEGPSCALHQSIYDYYINHPEHRVQVRKQVDELSDSSEDD